MPPLKRKEEKYSLTSPLSPCDPFCAQSLVSSLQSLLGTVQQLSIAADASMNASSALLASSITEQQQQMWNISVPFSGVPGTEAAWRSFISAVELTVMVLALALLLQTRE